jgi:hypothetical protein
MVVFNTNTFLQLIVAAIPAGIAYGLGSWLDGDPERWATITGLITLLIVDALWRLAAMGGDEDENAGQAPGAAALVMPPHGGHIFWLPNWLVGGLALYGVFAGFLH